MARKLFVLAVVLVLTTGMLVSCGNEEGSSAGQKMTAEPGKPQNTKAEPIDAVQVAYKKTVAAETARVKFTSVTSGIPGGSTAAGEPDEMQFRMTGEGSWISRGRNPA